MVCLKNGLARRLAPEIVVPVRRRRSVKPSSAPSFAAVESAAAGVAAASTDRS